MTHTTATSTITDELTELQRRATRLLQAHGLWSWVVRWDTAKDRAGQCRYGPREIGLSVAHMTTMSPAERWDMVTHEVAHALTPGAHHGPRWRAAHIALGGSGNRTHANRVVREQMAPWLGTCGCPGKAWRRFRRTRGAYCQSCGVSLKWRRVA